MMCVLGYCTECTIRCFPHLAWNIVRGVAQGGDTALIVAAYSSEPTAAVEMIKCLVEHGADVNAANKVRRNVTLV